MELFFAEKLPIPFHALAAIAAVMIGAVQIAMPKGTYQHKLAGRIWVGLMAFVALSSFFIYEIKLWGNYSPIHLVSIWTLFSLWLGYHYVKTGQIRKHKKVMVLLYFLGLILTGLFTFSPGRLMHEVLFAT